MTSDLVAVIPAKRRSGRVPNKNFLNFYQGLSLLEIKIRVLKDAGIRQIIVSSDNREAETIARSQRVEFDWRPAELCEDHVVLRDLFSYCLRNFQEAQVFWAHPTSPFVSAETIRGAASLSFSYPNCCILGVQMMKEFLWNSNGPVNYSVTNQPRSQDLPALFRITGGIHIARGSNFVNQGAVSFQPSKFIELSLFESIDINTPDELELARELAPFHVSLP